MKAGEYGRALLAVAKETRFELDKHSSSPLRFYCLTGILSGTKQTHDGEKEWEKGKEKGQTSPWHVEAHGGGVGSRAGCASAAGPLCPTRVTAPWLCTPLGTVRLPVTPF